MKTLIHSLLSALIYIALQTTSFAAPLAAELTVEAPSLKGSPILTIGYLFQVFISLLIVIGLIYVISKYLLPKLQIPTRGRQIEIVDRVGLEPQVTAYILKVKEKAWLVVSGKGSVEVVDKIELKKED